MDEKTGASPEMPETPPAPPPRALPAMPSVPPSPAAPVMSSVSARPHRSVRGRTVAGMVVAGLAIAGIASGTTALLISGSGKESGDAKPMTATSAPVTAPARDATEVSEEPEEAYNDSPGPEDFTLTLKTTQRQCFGSAGCNVTVEPRLLYAGVTPLDPEKTYSITYEVRGDESGPVIETMELTDRDQLTYQPVSLSTTSRSTKVTAEISDITASL